MRGVQRVAQQDDVLMAPVPIPHQREIYPADEIIGQKFVALEIVFKETPQICARFGPAFLIEPRALPSRLVEFVRIRDEMTCFVLAEGQRQPMKQLIRTQPDVFVLPHVNRRLEEILISAAHGAGSAVGADRQIALAIRFYVGHVGMKPQINAEFPAALAQYAQEFQPANARKPVAANRDSLAFVNDVDVVPDFAGGDDLLKRRPVARFEVRKGLVGKDYAPTEGVVGPVAFNDN